MADNRLLSYVNSKRWGRGSSGKFITIYPPNSDSFGTLIEELGSETAGFVGPYILSDRRYRDSHVVFYRYGGFRQTQSLNVDGTMTPIIFDPNGDPLPDERLPYFKVPPWVTDPLGDWPGNDAPNSTLLNGRFKVEKVLSFSNAGGVYAGRDVVTAASIVLKEARPLTSCWPRQGELFDSVAALEREFQLLERLRDLDCVPTPIALFTEWEHSFLAEEFVDGTRLGDVRLTDGLSLVEILSDQQRLTEFQQFFSAIAVGLIDAVASIHEQGVILGDVSPNNILFHSIGPKIAIIDLESAFASDEGEEVERYVSGLYTGGFRRAEAARSGRMTPEDDYRAVGMVLYSLLLPVQSLFEFEPTAVNVLLERLMQLGLRAPMAQIIQYLLHGEVLQARRVADQ